MTAKVIVMCQNKEIKIVEKLVMAFISGHQVKKKNDSWKKKRTN